VPDSFTGTTYERLRKPWKLAKKWLGTAAGRLKVFALASVMVETTLNHLPTLPDSRRSGSTPGLRMPGVHGYDESAERLSKAMLAYALDRLKLDPVPLDGPPHA
jgi:hypothetical protein